MPAGPEVRVPREGGERALALVDGGPVVDEAPDGQPLRELVGAAHVVAVEVGDDQVVDRCRASGRRGGGDAVGVAPVEARPARVDEHRLARRGDEERRLAPLDVDDVDVQRVVRPVLGRGDGRETETEHEGREGACKSHGVAPAIEIRVLDIDADNVACGHARRPTDSKFRLAATVDCVGPRRTAVPLDRDFRRNVAAAPNRTRRLQPIIPHLRLRAGHAAYGRMEAQAVQRR